MYRIFLLFVVICVLIVWWSSLLRAPEFDALPVYHVIVLPHHNLTGKHIDAYYQNLRTQFSYFDRIVIISPDHFWQLQWPVETSFSDLREICYLTSCVKNLSLPKYLPKNGEWAIFSQSGKTIEHGIGEHITRIARFFPNTPVTPIILRRKLNIGIEEKDVADTIAHLPEKRILVIASVDFSHHVREEIAQFHDQKSIDVLNSGLADDSSDLEVDCRNCLAIAKYVAMNRWNYFFHLTDRTSVDILSGSGADIENTSHIFGEFTATGRSDPEGIFLFAGDTHWARGFPYLETKISEYRSQALRILYQKYDPKNDPATKYHRVFSGFDDVIVNWESGVDASWSCQKSGKLTQMVTDPSVLGYFHSLGVTLANIANNHSHDCGKKAFASSIPEFLSGGIVPFWYEHIAFRIIRGNHFAFIGINMIEQKVDFQKVEKTIQSLTASGNIVIANIHFWVEYSSWYTEKQSQITHQLVDAWARLVVGHHPHVVGDNEIYKGIPIYYSLGNFIFDQPFPETLRGMLLLCSVNMQHTACRTVNIWHDPHTYALSFSPLGQ